MTETTTTSYQFVMLLCCYCRCCSNSLQHIVINADAYHFNEVWIFFFFVFLLFFTKTLKNLTMAKHFQFQQQSASSLLASVLLTNHAIFVQYTLMSLSTLSCSSSFITAPSAKQFIDFAGLKMADDAGVNVNKLLLKLCFLMLVLLLRKKKNC